MDDTNQSEHMHELGHAPMIVTVHKQNGEVDACKEICECQLPDLELIVEHKGYTCVTLIPLQHH